MRHIRLMSPLASATSAHRLVGLCVASAAWLAVMALTYAQTPVAPTPDDRAASVGRWAVVSVEWDGKPMDPAFLSLFQVLYAADGSWAVMFRSIPVAEGASTNHQEGSPKTFEMETLGSQGIKPTRYRGIYRLDGDTRVLCIAPDGKPRPDQFEAPKRSGRMLVTLKRVPAPPATPRAGRSAGAG
jgi:uncharacterized protein (TIGR03067 family)